MQSKILVVDDDADLRQLIGDFLAGHGYLVAKAHNAAEMFRLIDSDRPDLVILDIMMPGEDGLNAARRLAAERGPAVILLSALGSDTDRIIGLEVGADDYLGKPCNPRELLARVRAVLRRRPIDAAGAVTSESYEFLGWRLDVTRRDLRDPGGIYIELSDREFALLRSFVQHPRRVLTREQLLDFSSNADADVFDRAIDSQISRLRRKLQDKSGAELIRTVRNEGYQWLPRVRRL